MVELSEVDEVVVGVSLFDRAVELLRLCEVGIKVLCVVDDTSTDVNERKPVETNASAFSLSGDFTFHLSAFFIHYYI